MKKQYLILAFFIYATSAFSQLKYKPLKVDVGILLGEITYYNTGVIFPYVEPKFYLGNNMSAGLRLEYVIFSKNGIPEDENPYWGNLDADGSVFSLVPTVDKYFTQNSVRPFIGVGVGYFLVNSRHQNNYLNLTENLNTGGLLFRAGLNLGHFKISGEYNYVFSNKVSINYFTLKLGYEIGGGKKHVW